MMVKMIPDIQIFVISLEDAVARREPLLAQLDGFDLQYRVFSAVDGRNGLPSEFESSVDRDAALVNLLRPMADVEYACALSHMGVYKLILSANLKGAIVFEDDARLEPGFFALLGRVDFEGIDMVMFNYGSARVWRFGRKKTLVKDYYLLKLAHNTGLASAYYISARGAEFILDNGLPVSLPADWPCDLRALKPRLIYPRVASEGGRGSQLEEARAFAKQAAAINIEGSSDIKRRRGLRDRTRNFIPWHYRWFSRIFMNNIPHRKRPLQS